MQIYPSTSDYLAQFGTSRTLAVLPISQAAEHLEITPSAVVSRLRTGRLEGLQIGKTKFVLVASLQEEMATFEADVSAVQKQLKTYVKKGRVPIFYEPVMSPIGLNWQIPADRTRIGKILGAVSRRTHEEDGVLLTVIVHRKRAGTTSPGDGFFNLATNLGYNFNDSDAFVSAQTRRVIKAYG